jgi:hypothetical protein
MEDQCVRHQFEPIVDYCRSCGDGHCSECVVYAFGPDQPPYCVPCALTAAGVRSNAARHPGRSRREIRKQAKERKKAQKTNKAPTKVAVEPLEIDWSVPVMEDRDLSPAPEEPSPDWVDGQLQSAGDRRSF